MDISNYLIRKACSLCLSSFSAYEASKVFCVDYKNMCAYLSGRKVMPLKLAFKILDYLNAKVVVFRESF